MTVSQHSKGVSDDAVHAATGRHPDEWFALLDAQHATSWSHTEIARWLFAEHDDLDGWWSQSVTVRYEQARGMRLPGQQADGTFSVSATKTLPADQAAVLDAAIGVIAAEVGSAPKSDNRSATIISARWQLTGRETLLASAGAAKSGKTSLTLTHSRIPDEATAAIAKDTLTRLLAKLVHPLG